MTIDHRLNELIARARELEALEERLRQVHDNGGGGNGGGGNHLEQRITRVEAQQDKLSDKVDTVGERVGTLAERLGVLTERVGHLPSKGFIVGTVLSSLAVIAGLIAFGERLQSLVGS